MPNPVARKGTASPANVCVSPQLFTVCKLAVTVTSKGTMAVASMTKKMVRLKRNSRYANAKAARIEVTICATTITTLWTRDTSR